MCETSRVRQPRHELNKQVRGAAACRVEHGWICAACGDIVDNVCTRSDCLRCHLGPECVNRDDAAWNGCYPPESTRGTSCGLVVMRRTCVPDCILHTLCAGTLHKLICSALAKTLQDKHRICLTPCAPNHRQSALQLLRQRHGGRARPGAVAADVNDIHTGRHHRTRCRLCLAPARSDRPRSAHQQAFDIV